MAPHAATYSRTHMRSALEPSDWLPIPFRFAGSAKLNKCFFYWVDDVKADPAKIDDEDYELYLLNTLI